jgi:hypothetical protein
MSRLCQFGGTYTHYGIVSWLNEKVYALDACFKLSMKQGSALKRSNDDPELLPGNGVFVDENKLTIRTWHRQVFHLAHMIITF